MLAYGMPILFDYVHGTEESSQSEFMSVSLETKKEDEANKKQDETGKTENNKNDNKTEQKDEPVIKTENTEQSGSTTTTTKPSGSTTTKKPSTTTKPSTSTNANKTEPPYRQPETTDPFVEEMMKQPPYRNPAPLPDIPSINTGAQDTWG